MRKCLVSLLLLSGCGPLAVDATLGWGANQSIKKTLEMDQKQSKAQTEAGADFWEGLFDVLPGVVTATPSPTPIPTNRVSRITVELAPTGTPVEPELEVIEPLQRRKPAVRKKQVTVKKTTALDCQAEWLRGYEAAAKACEEERNKK